MTALGKNYDLLTANKTIVCCLKVAVSYFEPFSIKNMFVVSVASKNKKKEKEESNLPFQSFLPKVSRVLLLYPWPAQEMFVCPGL